MSDHSGADKVITLPALQTFKQQADSEYASKSHTHSQSDITGAVWFGTCSTAASTQVKAVTCSGFPASALTAGTVLIVSFTNAQSYNGAPILNVNGTGNVNIKIYGTTNAGRYEWYKGESVTFVHNGSDWVITQRGRATTSYYGVTKLNTSLTSTSTALSSTPYAINKAMTMLTGLPVYSSSATYAVGDRVRYSEGIYECTTAIATAEAWNDDHWTQMTDLLSMIDNKANASLVPNAGSVAADGTISIKNGSSTLFTIQLPLYSGGVS